MPPKVQAVLGPLQAAVTSLKQKLAAAEAGVRGLRGQLVVQESEANSGLAAQTRETCGALHAEKLLRIENKGLMGAVADSGARVGYLTSVDETLLAQNAGRGRRARNQDAEHERRDRGLSGPGVFRAFGPPTLGLTAGLPRWGSRLLGNVCSAFSGPFAG